MTKEFKIRINWSRREKDIIGHWPKGIGAKSDLHWIFRNCFNDDFCEAMKRRGYDIESIKFEIAIKPGARPEKFPTLHKKLSESK